MPTRNYLVCIMLLTAIILSGCAGQTVSVTPSKIERVSTPKVGEVSTANLGQALMYYHTVYTYDGVSLKELITDGGTAREYIMEPHNMRYVRTDEQGSKYFLASPNHYYVNDKLFNRRVPLSNQFFVVKRDGSVGMTGYYDLTTAGTPTTLPSFEIGDVVDVSRPNFKQELLYNGRSGSTIRFMYREFSGDLIRADFSQDLMYDIAEDNKVGFRDVVIEVIEATNTSITYRVLSHFQ